MRRLLLPLLALPLFAQETKTITRPSGLKVEVLTEGEPGTAPVPGDLVRIHYTGWLADGTMFDSSVDRGQPLRFVLGFDRVIEGWAEAIPLVNVGSRCKLFIPAALGYGDAGFPRAHIPPKADLVFEVVLVDVAKGPAFRAADAAKRKTTESGLKWEVLAEGGGDAITAKDVVELRCTAWTPEGRFLFSSAALGGPVVGEANSVRILREGEKFLPEAVLLMKLGGQYRLEVPSALCWAKTKAPLRIDVNAPTVWQVDVLRIVRFAQLDPDRTRKTASGIEVEAIKDGTGATPGPASQVAVYCTGWLEDGTEFRSSHRTGQPEVLDLRTAVGWAEALQSMKEGGICRLRVPAALAQGMAQVPANATLLFEIELLRVQ